jgi:hypothetical protein
MISPVELLSEAKDRRSDESDESGTVPSRFEYPLIKVDVPCPRGPGPFFPSHEANRWECAVTRLFTQRSQTRVRSLCSRMFGSSGACAACGQTIPATELVTRASGSVFHTKCFTCTKCGTQLTQGDR